MEKTRASRTRSRRALARAFHALSDAKRVWILERLRGGERCVCELTEELEAGQSLLSFHLKVLKDAGLVRARRAGRWVYYELNAEALEELSEFLSSLPAVVAGSRSVEWHARVGDLDEHG